MSQSNTRPRVGLIQLHPIADSTNAQSLEDLEFDIIAIHGLDAETPKTWVAWEEADNPRSRQVNWLQDDDMLTKLLPNARILTYQWNARYDDAASSATFNAQAMMLLDDIDTERHFKMRQGRRERPIIFIASCFGGLLLARALVTAATPDHVTRSGDSGAVLKCTIGAIFLGTPFRGSEARGRKAAEIRYEVALASGKACSPNMHQYLRQGSMHESSELDELITSFQGLINHHDFRFDITCAYETLTTKTSAYEKRLGDKYEEFARERPAEFVVVDHNSARLGGTKELALDARHNMLHKFNSPQDPSFLKIVRRLQEIIEKSHEIMNQKDHIQIFTHHNSQAKEQKQQDQKQEEWQAKCLEALDFDRIDYEPLQLREPGETACEWLIKDPSYSKWYSNGYGIFWILGHAGTGKSTLIKHAIESCVRQTRGGNDQDPTVALSFFFHSQGKLLQRTTEGLFRALFHQLLEKIPKEMKPFADTLDLRKSRLNQVGREDKMSSTNHDGSIWPTPYLMKHFQDSVERVLERLNIRIFVDALNECKDTESNEDVTKEMYNLVIKMQDMAERLRSKPRKFSICFACRHVSQLARLDGDNHVFAQNGNMKDVENYVCQELDREITSDEHRGLRDTLKKKLLQSANGNFLWVTTVVPKILTMYRGGRPDLLAELRKIPRKIEEFYAATVSSLAKETCAMSLKFFQWVCFATRPLEVHDIRFAINIIPDKKYRSFNELPKLFWGSTDEEMKNLVCTLSGGLAEVRNSTVFLIHQSVKDYMMGSGFYRLDPEQYDTQRVLKYGHDLLLTSCLWWSAESSILKAFDYFIASFSQEIIYLAFDSASEDLGGDFDCFPDLSLEDIRGAINNLSDPDRQAIRNFSKPEITHDWNKSLPPEYAKSTESLEFKEWLLVDEVLACLFAWIIIINNTPSVMGYMYAVSNWGDHALQSLVNASESDASDALKAGLDLFFSRADSTHILLHNLVFRTLHSEACLSNPVILRELLKRDVDKRLSLNLKGLEISTQLMSTSDKGMGGQTALLIAIEAKHQPIVESLINSGTDLNHQDHNGLTALMYAVRSDQNEILKLLLERGARTEIRDNKSLTAVDHATDRCFEGLSRHIIEKVRKKDRESWL